MAFDEFTARRLVNLAPENWDKFVRALDARFLVLEEQLGIQRQVTEAVLKRGLQVIEDELGPVVAEAQTTAGGIDQLARDLGLLLRASSASSLAIGTGEKMFVITDGERDRFAAPLYVIAAAEGQADIWMAGQVTDWDVTTGALTVAVTNSRGAGTYAAWDVSIAAIPPEAPPAQTAVSVTLAAVAGMTAADVQAAVEELHGAKAPLDSPALTGTPTAPTAAGGTNTTQLATTAFVKAAIDALINAAPGALDTLNELAAALGDDANFAATMTAALAGKQAASANLDTWSATGQATAAEYRTGTATDKALTVANVWAAWAEVTLAYAATVAPDFSAGFDFVLILSGNATLDNPVNPKVGQRGRIRIVQDVTGGRTLAFGANWKFVGGSAPSLSTAASAEDFLDYEVTSATRIRAALTKDVPA